MNAVLPAAVRVRWRRRCEVGTPPDCIVTVFGFDLCSAGVFPFALAARVGSRVEGSRAATEGSSARQSAMSEDEKTFDGQCQCGAVRIVVTGDPGGAGYCHCAACRCWSAGPVRIHALEARSGQGDREGPRSSRTTRSSAATANGARSVGGHLLTRHPQWGLVDVYAATVPSFSLHAPGCTSRRIDRATDQRWAANAPTAEFRATHSSTAGHLTASMRLSTTRFCSSGLVYRRP